MPYHAANKMICDVCGVVNYVDQITIAQALGWKIEKSEKHSMETVCKCPKCVIEEQDNPEVCGIDNLKNENKRLREVVELYEKAMVDICKLCIHRAKSAWDIPCKTCKGISQGSSSGWELIEALRQPSKL